MLKERFNFVTSFFQHLKSQGETFRSSASSFFDALHLLHSLFYDFMTDLSVEYPFAILEEYMLTDDDPSYPMDSIRLLHFTGFLSHSTLEKAFDALYMRHPFLTKRAERRGFRYVWVPCGRKPEIRWLKASAESINASGFPSMEPLHLLEEPGLRVYVVESETENWTKILLQFHHSVSDGLGEMQLIGELLTHYARISGLIPPDTPLQPVDASKLTLRSALGWSLGSYLRNFFHTSFTTRHLTLFSPNPLFRHTPRKRGTPTEKYPFLQSLALTPEETKAYIRKAKSANVTVNDLLLCDFFQTIDAWRVHYKRDFTYGMTRVMVPMSLRKPIHDGIPAANVVSSIFLDRTKKQMSGTRDELMYGIHREMEWVKKHDQKYVFILVLKIVSKIPGGLRLVLNSKKCRSTGVLSNLGRVMEIAPVPRNEEGKIQLGSNVLEFVDAAPPIRSQTMLSFSALTYAGTLRLCLRYDNHFLTPEDARTFLDFFHEQLTADLKRSDF